MKNGTLHFSHLDDSDFLCIDALHHKSVLQLALIEIDLNLEVFSLFCHGELNVPLFHLQRLSGVHIKNQRIPH